jgi:chromate transporter
VFLGAPFMERLRGNRALSGALAAITAAVVGVIANLSLWFALHVLFSQVSAKTLGPVVMDVPVLSTFDWRAGLIAVLAGIAIWRGAGLGLLLPGAAIAGLVLGLA